jgi:regulatory protein
MADDPGPGRPAGSGPRVARFDDVPDPHADAEPRDRVADLGDIADLSGLRAGEASGAASSGETHGVAGFDALDPGPRRPAAVVGIDALGSGERSPVPVAGFDGAGVTAAPAPARTADLTGPPTRRRRGDGARGRSRSRDAGEGAAGGDAPVTGAADERGRARARTRPAEGRGTENAADSTSGTATADERGPDPEPDRTSGRGSDRPGGRRRGRAGSRPEGLDPDADPVAVAREICLRLLTDRARTRHELAQALHRKGVPDDVAEQVLGRFDEVGLIDDAAFAGQWVRSRHRYRGLGRRAIAMELRRKGVDDEIAGEALAEVDGEAEELRARQLVDKKLRTMTLAGPEERTAAARRLVGMLARRGYGGGIAYGVVRAALAEHGADDEELGTDSPPDD